MKFYAEHKYQTDPDAPLSGHRVDFIVAYATELERDNAVDPRRFITPITRPVAERRYSAKAVAACYHNCRKVFKFV